MRVRLASGRLLLANLTHEAKLTRFPTLGRDNSRVADRILCFRVTIHPPLNLLPFEVFFVVGTFSCLVSESRSRAADRETLLAHGVSRIARFPVLRPCHEFLLLCLNFTFLQENHCVHFSCRHILEGEGGYCCVEAVRKPKQQCWKKGKRHAPNSPGLRTGWPRGSRR